MKISHKCRRGRHRKHPVPHGDHRRRPSYSRISRILRAQLELAMAPKVEDWIGEAGRPIASGIHVTPARQTMLGALGFTPVHRNDGRGLEPRPSHPTEERTLDGPCTR